MKGKNGYSNRGKVCKRCQIVWGADGSDTLPYLNARHCQRCQREIETGKMKICYDGGIKHLTRGGTWTTA